MSIIPKMQIKVKPLFSMSLMSFGFRVGVSGTALVLNNVFVAEADGSEGLLGIVVDDIVEVLVHFVGHLSDVAVNVQVVRAAVFDDF